MKDFFDLIVLGGGPAGFTAANRAAEQGLKTAIFERDKLGGVCLNEGCIPSKSFIHSAKKSETGKCDMAKWVTEKNSTVDLLRNGVRGSLRKNKVKIFFSNGIIKSYENGITIIEDSEGNEYSANNLIIATGSISCFPAIKGLNEALLNGFALSTSNIFDQTDDFSTMVIIGGGIIGVELAYCFSEAGKNVKIVEAMPELCGNLDRDCREATERSLLEKGITIYKSTVVSEILSDGVVLDIAGNIEVVSCDRVLVCTGRIPRLYGYGLEKIFPEAVKMIETDSKMRTSKKNVYAIGDVNGKSMLAHTAYREAEVCVNTIANHDDEMDYNLIPNVLYGTPEVACVGENEYDLEKKGEVWQVKRLPMSYSGRAVAEESSKNSFCKLVFDSGDVLRGAFLVGNYASEIIFSTELCIAEKFTIEKMKKIIYPHPSISEIIRETLYAKSEFSTEKQS